METEHIAIFLEVFDAGGFAPVAKARDVAPSTISRKIATLEQSLGVSLFVRTTRKLSPTVEGAQFEQRLRPISAEIADIVSEIKDDAASPSGLLRVSASVSYGQTVIAPCLGEFRKRYPNVQVELLLSDARINLVAEKVDVAIRHGKLRDSSYIASRLTDVSYHLLASPNYLAKAGLPQGLDDLSAHALLSFTYPDFRNVWTFRGLDDVKIDVPISPVMTASSAIAIRQFAEAGLGIALLPNWAIPDTGLEKVLEKYAVTGGHFDRAIWMMMPDRTYRAKRVTAFADYLRYTMKRQT